MNRGTNLLWYRQSARSWNEALPLGNGRLGAMVYGGAAEERVCLNEDTLWSAIPCSTTIPRRRRPTGGRAIWPCRAKTARQPKCSAI